MKQTYLIGASLLLMTAGLLPATAYHIDGYVLADPTGPAAGAAVPNPAADWTTTLGILTICESQGAFDDRNTGVAHQGLGGLCTTGRNDATGTPAPATQPGQGTWTQLDVCDAITATRLQVAGTPTAAACSAGVTGSLISTIQGNLGGRINAHAFTGRMGVFTCFVATDTEIAPVVNADQSLYYDELYAWWTYTVGDGFYTPAEAPGAFHTVGGAGGDGFPNNDYTWPAGQPWVTSPTDSEAAWHGHATVFVLPDRSEPGASMAGSIHTANVAGGFAAIANPQPCDGSPADGTGPVVVGDSGVPQTIRACMDIGFLGVRTTYPCRVGPSGNACPATVGLPAAVVGVAVASFDVTDAFTTATGRISCTGPAGGFTAFSSCSVVLPGGLGCTGAPGGGTVPPLAPGALTCTRDMPPAGPLNSFPHDGNTMWVVACADGL